MNHGPSHSEADDIPICQKRFHAKCYWHITSFKTLQRAKTKYIMKNSTGGWGEQPFCYRKDTEPLSNQLLTME